MDGGYPSASRYFGDLFLVADVRYGEPQGIDVYRQADLIVWYDALVAWAEEQDDAVDLHDAVGEIEWPKDVEETAAA
jgi:hypothetical protein